MTRELRLEIEVAGTPEEVWEAIATGPGISSWYVPHTFEEHEGAEAVASFGDTPEMQIPGRVAAYEPPHRIVFAGEEGYGPAVLAFEWLVEARDGGTCIVRLVNSGFGDGDDWDAQYDAMRDGWMLFLRNLQLHLAHFRGEHAVSMLPMAVWSGDRDRASARLLRALGIDAPLQVGQRVASSGSAPAFAGTVLDASPWRLALLLDAPAPGTAFIAAENMGDQVGVSVWSYLYGPHAAAIVERDKPRWQAWLAEHANDADDTPGSSR